MLLLVTKYLSIYHSALMNSIDEDPTSTKVAWGIILVPGILTTLEYGVVMDIEQSSVYQTIHYGHINDNFRPEPVEMTMIILNVILMILVQARVEYDRFMLGESGKSIYRCTRFLNANPKIGIKNDNEIIGNDNEHTDKLSFKVGFIRILVLLGILVLIVVLFNAFNMDEVDPKYSYVGVNIILFAIIPWSFVLKHSRIKSVAMKTYPVVLKPEMEMHSMS